MPSCPFCKADLTEADISARVCRACRKALPGAEQTAQLAVTTEQIERLWAKSITADATPGTTIKEKEEAGEAPSGVAVRPRTLARADKPMTPPADYELIHILGEGGMGVVYTARQTSFDRRIALKMIKPGASADSAARRKFLAEAVVTADLEHPNIVPAHDLGADEEGRIFYAMKQVKGVPWKHVIRQKTQAENIGILLRVCDAVAFAHSKGVVHRDLKPENVMLGDFGEVLVMDWGLALSVMEGSKAERITKETVCAGSPAYMAPEMAAANVRLISPASDIYLLGAILYEIVAGFPPHGGRTVIECIHNAANNIIQPTEKKGELIDIARKAMATERAQRYASARDFQAAVREYQSHSESIGLAARAQEALACANETRDYGDFARALFGFRQALEWWPENKAAADGVLQVSLSYGRCALAKGDLDLAASLLVNDTYEERQLLAEITQAQRERRSRQQRIKILSRSAAALAAAVLVVLLVAVVWVNSARKEAESQRSIAEAARTEAREEAEALAEIVSSMCAIGGRAEGERDRIRLGALRLAERAGLAGKDMRAVRLSVDLMDVGRVTIRDILQDFEQKGLLTQERLQKIMEASQIARGVTSRVRLLRDLGVPDIVGGIWENWDGTGYPNKLKGEAIPRGARILKIAWMYTVLTRSMPGREKPQWEDAVKQIEQQSGKAADPTLVQYFADIVKSEPALRRSAEQPQ
ncbi:MAG: protein kinase [Planctomycetota bacterium]